MQVMQCVEEGSHCQHAQTIRDLVHAVAGVKESEIRPVIAFLREHLKLSHGGEDEATQQGAAAAGGEQELSIEGGEELAEVQFPSA